MTESSLKTAKSKAKPTTKLVKKHGPKPRIRAGSTSKANMIVAENLYRLRRASGLTQVQLCDFAAVSRSFYHGVESCSERIAIDYLEKLRPVLKCSWADIFKGLD